MTPDEPLQTPLLVIHLDRVRHNIAHMLALCGGPARWRPHVKTCKVPEVLALLLDAGVRQFKVATTRELAVMLELADTPIDVLVAIAHHGANLRRVLALAQEHPGHRVAMISEDPTHAAELARHGMSVFVDLDPGYGRSGIPLREADRIAAVMRAAGDRLRGLHCYEGHITDDDPAQRRQRTEPIYRELCSMLRGRERQLELVTSGTPGFPGALAWPGFRDLRHQVSPGTVVYWDARSAALGIVGFQCAVEVHTTVVSRPAPNRFTTDCGSKAIDAAAGRPCVVFPQQPRWQAMVPSEEHLPVEDPAGKAPLLGTRIVVVPRHVCPTVNLADHAALYDGNVLQRVVAVRARGHEV